MELPQRIRNQIEGKEYQIDETGMSGSRILLFSDMVLKVQRKSRETEQELCMMEWLQDRLPVPRILAKEEAGEEQFLLMSRLEGEMMCEETYMENPVLQTKVLTVGSGSFRMPGRLPARSQADAGGRAGGTGAGRS